MRNLLLCLVVAVLGFLGLEWFWRVFPAPADEAPLLAQVAWAGTTVLLLVTAAGAWIGFLANAAWVLFD